MAAPGPIWACTPAACWIIVVSTGIPIGAVRVSVPCRNPEVATPPFRQRLAYRPSKASIGNRAAGPGERVQPRGARMGDLPVEGQAIEHLDGSSPVLTRQAHGADAHPEAIGYPPAVASCGCSQTGARQRAYATIRILPTGTPEQPGPISRPDLLFDRAVQRREARVSGAEFDDHASLDSGGHVDEVGVPNPAVQSVDHRVWKWRRAGATPPRHQRPRDASLKNTAIGNGAIPQGPVQSDLRDGPFQQAIGFPPLADGAKRGQRVRCQCPLQRGGLRRQTHPRQGAHPVDHAGPAQVRIAPLRPTPEIDHAGPGPLNQTQVKPGQLLAAGFGPQPFTQGPIRIRPEFARQYGHRQGADPTVQAAPIPLKSPPVGIAPAHHDVGVQTTGVGVVDRNPVKFAVQVAR